MSDTTDRKGPQRCIDATAKAHFLDALRRGERREDAAAAAGFTLMAFYGARRGDAAFRADWTEALATSAAAERRARAYEERGQPGEVRIAMANRRIYQRRRRRNVRFDAAAQAAFLTHFAETCDTKAAAAAAGVHEATVNLHRRTDREFAEAFDRALAEGYVKLEAEAVRQRVAAQARFRDAIEAADAPPRNGHGGGALATPTVCPERSRRACPECGRTDDPDAEFDRIMRLLARWDRKPRHVDSRFKPGGRRQPWTFDRAIALLDKRLRAMGARTSTPPPDICEE